MLCTCAQTDEQEVINFLLTTEIIPLCLKIMESGSELSKTVSMSAAFCCLMSVTLTAKDIAAGLMIG